MRNEQRRLSEKGRILAQPPEIFSFSREERGGGLGHSIIVASSPPPSPPLGEEREKTGGWWLYQDAPGEKDMPPGVLHLGDTTLDCAL